HPRAITNYCCLGNIGTAVVVSLLLDPYFFQYSTHRIAKDYANSSAKKSNSEKSKPYFLSRAGGQTQASGVGEEDERCCLLLCLWAT
ncbi:MAG TPA: hypothetical protein PK572_07770, partial [Kiritimatiellia bacterium]|nr:hypothetical protein [Kiritimatiellia bacterium]